MDEWRHMMEAPTDTAVLVWGSGIAGYEVAHYNTSLAKWVACWDHRPLKLVERWMPLPAPPTI